MCSFPEPSKKALRFRSICIGTRGTICFIGTLEHQLFQGSTRSIFALGMLEYEHSLVFKIFRCSSSKWALVRVPCYIILTCHNAPFYYTQELLQIARTESGRSFHLVCLTLVHSSDSVHPEHFSSVPNGSDWSEWLGQSEAAGRMLTTCMI